MSTNFASVFLFSKIRLAPSTMGSVATTLRPTAVSAIKSLSLTKRRTVLSPLFACPAMCDCNACLSASGYWDRCCRGRNYPARSIYPLCSAPSACRTPVPSAFLLASHFRANLSGTSHGFIRDGDGHLCAAELLRGEGRCGGGHLRAPVSMPAGPVGLAMGGQLSAAVLPLLSMLTAVSNWTDQSAKLLSILYSCRCLSCIVETVYRSR